MKKLLTLLSFLALHFSLFVGEALAQTPPPSSTAVPLDGFSGLLIAAGAAASYRALRNNDSED